MRKVVVYIYLGILFTSCHAKRSVVTTKTEISTEGSIQKKYATKLGVTSSEIVNVSLYTFVDEWIGVKYLYGGSTKKGADCSGFSSVLYKSVYGKIIPRRSADIADACSTFKKDKLQEGDFVFFKISGNKVSHVGIYLTNNYFAHASTSRGVVISSLTEAYYTKHFWKGGRLKTSE